jgi:2-(1,2-epoxy-1,2-dihydrophenyl)acetyl-CoA isomerase
MATDTDADTVRVERVDIVARVVLDRPDRHNAMDVEMADALHTTLFDAVDDREVRAVVVTGTGPAFHMTARRKLTALAMGGCHTEADLDAMTGDRPDSRRFRAITTRLHSAVATVATANVPTVTAINGVAADGGLGLALSGDLVFVNEDARFEFAYPRIVLSGDGGSTWSLQKFKESAPGLDPAAVHPVC